jgi:hypothetical protein
MDPLMKSSSPSYLAAERNAQQPAHAEESVEVQETELRVAGLL